ncbi:MAG: TauD/TfdA family dioxygenase [Myxococcota bacterium]
MPDFESISDRIGARVHGVDLARGIDDATWAAVEAAWNDRHLLVFPDQTDLGIEAQVAFLGRFGPVLEERVPGERHSWVSNADGHGTDEMNDGYREGPLTAHMDYTYTPFPADAISLWAETLPETGSETVFYSNVAPLDEMPPALREELSTYHAFCAHDLAAMKPDAKLYLEGRTDPDAPTQSHTWPLIRRHPHKPGVEALVCTLQQTERILELSDEASGDAESRAMLGRIYDEHLYTETNRYVHAWRPHDLVVWDNVALQHAREACPRVVGSRVLRRVAVCAAGNAIHETVAFLGLRDGSVAFS